MQHTWRDSWYQCVQGCSSSSRMLNSMASLRSLLREEHSVNGTHSRCCRLFLSRDSNLTKPDTLAALSAWVPEPPWRGVTTTSGLAILYHYSSISDHRSIPEEHAFDPQSSARMEFTTERCLQACCQAHQLTPIRPKIRGDDISFTVTISSWTQPDAADGSNF